jgi:hypothetical protein
MKTIPENEIVIVSYYSQEMESWNKLEFNTDGITRIRCGGIQRNVLTSITTCEIKKLRSSKQP